MFALLRTFPAKKLVKKFKDTIRKSITYRRLPEFGIFLKILLLKLQIIKICSRIVCKFFQKIICILSHNTTVCNNFQYIPFTIEKFFTIQE